MRYFIHIFLTIVIIQFVGIRYLQAEMIVSVPGKVQILDHHYWNDWIDFYQDRDFTKKIAKIKKAKREGRVYSEDQQFGNELNRLTRKYVDQEYRVEGRTKPLPKTTIDFGIPAPPPPEPSFMGSSSFWVAFMGFLILFSTVGAFLIGFIRG